MPLSADEQRLLDQLEASLRAEDPDLASKFDAPPPTTRGPRRWLLAGVCFITGIALLVVGMLLTTFWISVIGFLIMFAGVAVVMIKSFRPGDPAPVVPDDASSLFRD
jgi:hypothetical protein